MTITCARCGAEIGKSDGFISASDFLLVADGKLPADEVAGICGRCDLALAAETLAQPRELDPACPQCGSDHVLVELSATHEIYAVHLDNDAATIVVSSQDLKRADWELESVKCEACGWRPARGSHDWETT